MTKLKRHQCLLLCGCASPASPRSTCSSSISSFSDTGKIDFKFPLITRIREQLNRILGRLGKKKLTDKQCMQSAGPASRNPSTSDIEEFSEEGYTSSMRSTSLYVMASDTDYKEFSFDDVASVRSGRQVMVHGLGSFTDDYLTPVGGDRIRSAYLLNSVPNDLSPEASDSLVNLYVSSSSNSIIRSVRNSPN